MSGNFVFTFVFLLFLFNVLIAETDICREHCLVSYDGCNTCDCVDGDTTVCTHLPCPRVQHKESICKECFEGYSWNNNTKQCENEHICAQHCQIYYDGCNDCICNKNNSLTVCSELVCFWKDTPECIECDAGYVWNSKTMECEKKMF